MNKYVIMVILLLFGVSCSSTIGTGSYIGMKESKYKKISGSQVIGKSCRTHIFFFPVGKYDLGYAFSDAMKKAPSGTEGLADVEISYSYPVLGGFLFGQYCYHVKGTPAKRS